MDTSKIDIEDIAKRMGAQVINLHRFSKEESEKYTPIGSLVTVNNAKYHLICYYGSKMLQTHKKTLEDIAGYRILGKNEEKEFKKKIPNPNAIVVRYYKKNHLK